jgi:protein-S-isoprenylcysteine O-methyltransferase Ste14
MTFGALFALWVLSELRIGKLGLHLSAIESDRGSALAVLFTGLAGVGMGLLAASLRWLPVYEAWPRWLGLGVMLAGLALRVYSILWLGPMFTRFVQIVPNHRLVTGGPYRYMRHPSYSGLLLYFGGMGLALGDWLSLLLLLGLPLAGVHYRIKVEEETLLATFGDEYRLYMARVGGLVPFTLSRR